jgi:hypothetical protein
MSSEATSALVGANGSGAEHSTIISADCHGGGSHAQYREYLEERYLDDFDAWRGKYRNPYQDLGDQRRYRNWDDEMRNSQQEADGVVAEVVFPNTVPPFFPSFVQMRKILSENAAKLYDFDLAALAKLAAVHGATVAELATPLQRLPDDPNDALRRGAGAAVA